MTPTSQKITVAGVLAALISAAGFVWTQWAQVRTVVEEKPIILAIAGAALALAVGFGFARSAAQKRHMSGRVRRARPTDRCRTCGYPLEGLETAHIDSTTRPYDQARCPECGRLNKVEADKQE
jgi:hypothetical protein